MPSLILSLVPFFAFFSTPNLPKKLPDISEYNGDMEKSDAWEQQLIQQIHINHDRYPSNAYKIVYAKSRLTIGKKTHNLMNQYKSEELYILLIFAD